MDGIPKALQALRRGLPAYPATPHIDEDGDIWRPGFAGNCSQSPLYVTDGHILLLAAAIDPAITLEQNEESWVRRHVNETEIGNVWKPAEKRSDVNADFIGVYEYGDDYQTEVAFLRDALGRVMIVNAHLLAFGVRAVHPGALTMDRAPIEATCMAPRQVSWFNSPLALRRAGELVGLLMPMRFFPDDFQQYDMHGEPVGLSAQAAV